jgi:hypothetical protein
MMLHHFLHLSRLHRVLARLHHLRHMARSHWLLGRQILCEGDTDGGDGQRGTNGNDLTDRKHGMTSPEN